MYIFRISEADWDIISRTASMMGISLNTLYEKIAKKVAYSAFGAVAIGFSSAFTRPDKIECRYRF